MTNIDVDTIVFWAFRYALGRQTYAVTDVCYAIRDAYEEGTLKPQTAWRIVSEIDAALASGRISPVDVPDWRDIASRLRSSE